MQGLIAGGGVLMLAAAILSPAAATERSQGEPGAQQTPGAAAGTLPTGEAAGGAAAGEKPSEGGAAMRPGRAALRAQVMAAARAAGMPAELADAVATVESNYNTGAIGGVGEIGLMQVLPSTARMLGFTGTLQELAVPETNIRYGVRYLSEAWRLSGGDICTTVMKYRAGHGESRFSHRSVAYCVRVREHMAGLGYKVTGVVPQATFGDPAGAVRVAGKRGGGRLAARSRYNWRAADARMKAISSKISSASLIIAR